MIGYLIGVSLVSFVIGKCCGKTKIVEVEKKPKRTYKRKTTAIPKAKETKIPKAKETKITKTELKKKYIEQYGENFKKLLNAKYIVAFPYHQKWKNKGEEQNNYYPRILCSNTPLSLNTIFGGLMLINDVKNTIHLNGGSIKPYLKALEDLGYKLNIIKDYHNETEKCYFKEMIFITKK